jgi:hypothetical protein
MIANMKHTMSIYLVAILNVFIKLNLPSSTAVSSSSVFVVVSMFTARTCATKVIESSANCIDMLVFHVKQLANLLNSQASLRERVVKSEDGSRTITSIVDACNTQCMV